MAAIHLPDPKAELGNGGAVVECDPFRHFQSLHTPHHRSLVLHDAEEPGVAEPSLAPARNSTGVFVADQGPVTVDVSNRHDGRFLLAQGVHELRVAVQARADQLRRRESQPLIERDVGEVVALEDLQEPQRRVAGVLDVVTHGEGDVADIVGLEIECARLAGRREHAHACLALDVVLPFVGIRMPVQLAHPAGLDLDQRRRDGLGRPETPCVSVIRAVPFFIVIGVCAIMRWLKLCGTAVAPVILSALSGPGTGAGKM